MGIIGKAKESYLQNEQRRAATLVNVEYIGGYQDKKKALGNLMFHDDNIEFKVALNSRASFAMPLSQVSDITLEGKDEVSRRVTVGRLVAFGIFAFALKKKGQDKDAFITVESKDGQEAIFHVKNKSPMDLKAQYSQIILKVKNSSPKFVTQVSPIGIADELTKLAKLKKDGILSQSEFDKKKTELLG